MSTLGDVPGEGPLSALFGGKEGVQQFFLWSVVSSLVNTLISPIATNIQQEVVKGLVDAQGSGVVPISPADLASMVVRNFLDIAEAAAEAAKSGISEGQFRLLVNDTGDAPAPGQLVVALRRGLIGESGTGADSTSFQQGIAEGNLKDKWTDMMRGLAVEWPTPTDALAAVLEGQVSESEGRALYEKFGGDPDYFQLLFNTRGNAPTPVEALRMANRGIIPWDGTGPQATSFQQAFLEGPWRDKWEPSFRKLAEYVPPPGTVAAFERHAVIDKAEADALYAKQGMTPDVVQAYALYGRVQKVAGSKLITESIILDLFVAGVMARPEALARLAELGYDTEEAGFVLESYQSRQMVDQLTTTLRKIGNLYSTHKLTRQGAAAALAEVGITGSAAATMLGDWDAERTATVRQLTESQIVDAVYYKIWTEDEGITGLQQIGYTAYDAWTLLSIKAKGKLPGMPPPGPPGPGTLP